jgi:hypothetical protein
MNNCIETAHRCLATHILTHSLTFAFTYIDNVLYLTEAVQVTDK